MAHSAGLLDGEGNTGGVKMKPTLEIGKVYRVKHLESKRFTKRIFKGMEKRFGDIDCYVFSSRLPYPVSELSIPHYELMVAIPST